VAKTAIEAALPSTANSPPPTTSRALVTMISAAAVGIFPPLSAFKKADENTPAAIPSLSATRLSMPMSSSAWRYTAALPSLKLQETVRNLLKTHARRR
jgi:hypothetical protein